MPQWIDWVNRFPGRWPGLEELLAASGRKTIESSFRVHRVLGVICAPKFSRQGLFIREQRRHI